MNDIKIEFISKNKQHSEFDWANINKGDTRVGKARCMINDNELIIYSINVFPEFEGNGYGKIFCEKAKEHFDTIIADRVRYSAVGFWDKMGFVDNHDGNWIYRKKT